MNSCNAPSTSGQHAAHGSQNPWRHTNLSRRLAIILSSVLDNAARCCIHSTSMQLLYKAATLPRRYYCAFCRPSSRCFCRASIREPKDPKQFTSMDEAREYLHRRENRGPNISGLLNYISESAFGQQLQQVCVGKYVPAYGIVPAAVATATAESAPAPA